MQGAKKNQHVKMYHIKKQQQCFEMSSFVKGSFKRTKVGSVKRHESSVVKLKTAKSQ